MKLHFSPASPYVRKVLVLAHEVGLAERIERVECALTPIAPNDAVVADNPLGKVPTLVTDDGVALYDSRVICEYLDSLHDGPRMFPAAPAERWAALSRQALADGILDAAVIARYETALRPESLRWQEWIDGQTQKFRRALDELEEQADLLANEPDIGTIAIGCALGYIDFRYDHERWRASRPQLAAWYGDFSARPSMRATVPA